MGCSRSRVSPSEQERPDSLSTKKKKKTYILPQPSPPTKSRAEIFDSVLYEQIDKHARKVVGKSLNGTYEELAFLITKPCQSDLGRARAIFAWLAAVNPRALATRARGRPKKGSPLEYIKKMDSGTGNNAYMYSNLCLAAGVPCTIINGINKNSAYKIGNAMVSSELGAQWNAVLIDNQWRLVDPFWGSTCAPHNTSKDSTLVQDNKNSGDTVLRIEPPAEHVLNNFFFLTDPKKLITTHFPKNQQWQMLDNPVNIEMFENQAYLRDRFFDMDAQLIGNSLPYCVNDVMEGEVEIMFGIPTISAKYLQFTYIIYQENRQALPNSYPLKRYVFYQKKTESVRFIVQFPVDGHFKVDIFGRHKLKDDTMELVASYIAVAIGKRDAQPLPDEPDIGWGPEAEMAENGVVAYNNEPIIETDDGLLELHFKKSTPLIVMQVMLHNTMDDWLLQRTSVIQQDSNDVVVYVRLPEPGQYALKIFVNDQEGNGEPVNICNYLLKSVNPNATPILFPILHCRTLGKGRYAEYFQIEADSFPESHIKTKNRKLDLVFAHPLHTELGLLLTSNTFEDVKLVQSVIRVENDGQTEFQIDLPDTGEYGINIFGKIRDSESTYHVYSSLVEFIQEKLNENEQVMAGLGKMEMAPIDDVTSVVYLPTGKAIEVDSTSLGDVSTLSDMSSVPDTKEATDTDEFLEYLRNRDQEGDKAREIRGGEREKMEQNLRDILRNDKFQKDTTDGIKKDTADGVEQDTTGGLDKDTANGVDELLGGITEAIETMDDAFVVQLRCRNMSEVDIDELLKEHLKEAEEIRHRKFAEKSRLDERLQDILGNKNKADLEQMDEDMVTDGWETDEALDTNQQFYDRLENAYRDGLISRNTQRDMVLQYQKYTGRRCRNEAQKQRQHLEEKEKQRERENEKAAQAVHMLVTENKEKGKQIQSTHQRVRQECDAKLKKILENAKKTDQ